MKPTLKAYQTQLKKLKAEYEVLNTDCKNRQRELGVKKNHIRDLEYKIEKYLDKDIVVSEHAVLRYLERSLDLDIEVIKKRILTEEIRKQYEVLGNGSFPIDSNVKAVIRDNIVVTVK